MVSIRGKRSEVSDTDRALAGRERFVWNADGEPEPTSDPGEFDLCPDGDARSAAAGVGGCEPFGLVGIKGRGRREPRVPDDRCTLLGQRDRHASASGIEGGELRKAGKAAHHGAAVFR